MKRLVLIILPVILLSCARKSANSENNVSPKGFQQITYLLDTIADNHVMKELRNIAEVKFKNNGEIKSAIQTNFSFEHQDGINVDGEEIYSPDLSWIEYQGSEFSLIYQKYAEQELTDTLIKDGNYTFQYDEKSQLISFTEAGGWTEIHFIYDQYGQWTKITQHILEERSGNITYLITKREIQYTDEALNSMKPDYLTINDENIFAREKKSIVDYYILSRNAAIFSAYNDGGMFDVPNGYFEYDDEGTGAGIYTGQLALFKTNDGQDILAIGWYGGEAVSYYHMFGDPPRFYLFENNMFTEISDIFPEVNIQMFFDSDYTGSVEGISTYFSLPKKGLSIQYKIGEGIENFCKNLDNTHNYYDDYKEICDRYSNVKRTSIEIEFDKVSGTFKINN